jgi:hypothetical protein
MNHLIFGWVRAGFRDCLFQAIIVGGTRPYSTIEIGNGFKMP